VDALNSSGNGGDDKEEGAKEDRGRGKGRGRGQAGRGRGNPKAKAKVQARRNKSDGKVDENEDVVTDRASTVTTLGVFKLGGSSGQTAARSLGRLLEGCFPRFVQGAVVVGCPHARRPLGHTLLRGLRLDGACLVV